MNSLLLPLLNFAAHRGVVAGISRRITAPFRSAMSLAFAFAMLLPISGAQADSEGFLDNWNGDIKVELRALGLGQPGIGTFPATDPHESLRVQFNRIWGAPKARSILCGEACAWRIRNYAAIGIWNKPRQWGRQA